MVAPAAAAARPPGPVGGPRAEAPPRARGDAGAVTAVEQADFRSVLSHFASGVVVVAASGPSGPVGLSLQSFFSLSLEPPLVALAPSRTSTTWPVVAEAGSFCANVLRDDQEALCRTFARSGADKFAGVGWAHGPVGAPRLHDALAWVDCEIERVDDGGDHWLVVARVVAMEASAGEPLVFYRSGFGSFRL